MRHPHRSYAEPKTARPAVERLPLYHWSGELPPLEPTDKLRVSKPERWRPHQLTVNVVGPHPAGVAYQCPANTRSNLIGCIRSRVLGPRREAEDGFFDRVAQNLADDRRFYPNVHQLPTPWHNWKRRFTAGIQDLLEREMRRFRAGYYPTAEYGKYSIFLKQAVSATLFDVNASEHFEELCTTLFALPKGCPRGISGCDPKRKGPLGPYFDAYSKRWHNMFGPLSRLYYAIGGKPDEFRVWFNRMHDLYPEDYLCSTDFSRYDRTIGGPALRLEASFIKSLGMPKRNFEIWSTLLKSFRANSRDGVHIRALPRRATGDMDTSWGNTAIHIALFQSFLVEYNVPDVDGGAGAFAGDDGILFLHPRWRPQLLEYYKRAGLNPKFRHVECVADVNFCSCIQWPTERGDYKPGPTMKCFFKLMATCRHIKGAVEGAAHLKGVCLGLKDFTAHVPLLGLYVNKILSLFENKHHNSATDRVVRKAKAEFLLKYEKFATTDPDRPSPNYRSFFLTAYRMMTYSLLVECENFLLSLEDDVVFESPCWQRLRYAVFARDLR